jgi:hypothetical protein
MIVPSTLAVLLRQANTVEVPIAREAMTPPISAPMMKMLLNFLLFAAAALAQMQSVGLNETLAAAKLSTKEIGEIIFGVEKSAYDVPESWTKELRVRRVDLGNGPGLVIRGTELLCGGTGNCQIWVFRNVNGRWASLFDTAPIAEAFQLGPAVTRGIKDLTITSNVSADAGTRTIYKFDGKGYRVK